VHEDKRIILSIVVEGRKLLSMADFMSWIVVGFSHRVSLHVNFLSNATVSRELAHFERTEGSAWNHSKSIVAMFGARLS
jgi:hypothetical protein